MSAPQDSPPPVSGTIKEILDKVVARLEAQVAAATLAALAEYEAQRMARTYRRNMDRLGLGHIETRNFEN